jgi:hypothetical protein
MGAALASRLLTLEQWCIGWAETSIAQFLEAPGSVSFRWLKPRHRHELLADPFGLEENGRLTIFAERLTYGRTKGQLVRIDASAPEPAPSLLLKKPFHLSYPFIVEEDGRRYVVPEQAESGMLAFYALDEAQTRAGLGAPAATIERLDAVDPTFLRHEGLWWLFCTHRARGPNRALHLYYAERLLGPYRAHPQNPVVSDAAHARPAGRIIDLGGRLLRPAQDCAASYGAAIALCEIETLTPTRYAERVTRRLTPGDVSGGFAGGLHTLDHTPHFVLIDTKRMAVTPWAAPLKLAGKIAAQAPVAGRTG